MYKQLLLTFIFLTTIASAVMASDVVVEPNQAKLEINGAVCAYCAYGVQKSLSKKPFVDKTQGHKGVESDIENQIITIYLKSGQPMNLQEVYDSIKKGGYEPRTFHLRVEGLPVKEGDQTYLTNTNNEKLFTLVGEQVKQLKEKVAYDLQLVIDENALLALKKDPIPVAQVNKIIQGE